MKIAALFDPQCMTMDLKATSKWDAIAELSGMLLQAGLISSIEDYLQAVREREQQVSTGVGMGIAIPHGKSDAVLTPAIAFGRSQAGIDFDAIDGEPAYLVFLLAVPASSSDREYLATLARLARLLVHPSFQRELLAASSEDEVLAAIERSEAQRESVGTAEATGQRVQRTQGGLS